MEKISGYSRDLARVMVEQQQNRQLFGKPYLKLGQCHALWGYFFQLGGILGAKHSDKLDAFAAAFINAHGEPGVVFNFFTKVADRLVSSSINEAMSFTDFVSAEFEQRVSSKATKDEVKSFGLMERVSKDTAEELAWQYSQEGAALGAIYPNIIRKMYERTYVVHSKAMWEEARAAGLDLPPEQKQISYEKTEEIDNEAFMVYCQERYPSLHSILSAK